MSKIEWTNVTWNPVVGCDKVSAGCANCYAIRMAWRLMHSDKEEVRTKYAGTVDKSPIGRLNWTGRMNFPKAGPSDIIWDDNLIAPLRWRNKIVFVNSMSDLFHKDIPDWFIDCVFAIMVLSPKNTFQLLTKRAARMADYFAVGRKRLIDRWEQATYTMGLSDKNDDADAPACQLFNYLEDRWPIPNVWVGVSVENQVNANERIPYLMGVPAAVRFLSCEPLLGSIDLSQYTWLDWVIVGGESGPKARPMQPEWVLQLRDQCQSARIPFFFKQWGEYNATLERVGKKANGRLLDGKLYNEFPAT